MLWELSVVEQRYTAVTEVLGGMGGHRGGRPLWGQSPVGPWVAAPLSS